MDHSPTPHAHVPTVDVAQMHADIHAQTHAHAHNQAHAQAQSQSQAVDFTPQPGPPVDIPRPVHVNFGSVNPADFDFEMREYRRRNSSAAGSVVGTIIGVVFFGIWLSVAGFILSQAVSMRHPSPYSGITSTTPLNGSERLLFPPGGIQIQPR